ncbi:hypothetical protein D3871_27820 [Noviherbaspirillum saxi]|uniref:Cellulose synthase (UDP-forming) n=2 Tax=Noviherbaspirillum saxi TaxID=2320863 RepID=A0A3A3FJ67_9BURK|nr:hypothetical protein D3871_27820 [Noviherbaspirillum saxi]
MACLMLFGAIVSVDLSLNSQIVVSSILVCVALYVRRYAGLMMTLVLAIFSLVVTSRYLLWRFTQTLADGLTIDFALGFCLCAAELYLALFAAIRLIRAIWPIRRDAVPMPADLASWPTIDVFVLCHGQSAAAIEPHAGKAAALEWPRKKIKLYLLDGDDRDDVKAVADAIGAVYLAAPVETQDRLSTIAFALSKTSGEFITVLDCAHDCGTGFLKSVVGWFARDARLGMLQTPYHFLVPPPTATSLRLSNGSDRDASCALFRRSALAEAIDTETANDRINQPLALKLRALGYGIAYIGTGGDAAADGRPGEPSLATNTDIFRVDHPFSRMALRAKQWLLELEGMFNFYYVFPRLIFYTAPVAYLLTGVTLIRSSPDLLAAYALPHFIHGHIVLSRIQGPHRFGLLADIRESLLACYILVPTTLNLIRTRLGKALRLRSDSQDAKAEVFSWTDAIPFLAVFTLNLAGLGAGLVYLLTTEASIYEAILPYLLWCGVNLMLLTSSLAVAEEAREIRRHTRLSSAMHAMVRLPYGRTMSCVTANFPDVALTLKLPKAVTVEAGAAISLSLFQGHQEFIFLAQVVTQENNTLHVKIDDQMQQQYNALAAGVLSRGDDWPKWLAGRHADQLVPAWISKGLVSALTAVLDFATNPGQYMSSIRKDEWIRFWKKRND